MKQTQNCLITLCKYIISVIQYNYVMLPMNETGGLFGDGNHYFLHAKESLCQIWYFGLLCITNEIAML